MATFHAKSWAEYEKIIKDAQVKRATAAPTRTHIPKTPYKAYSVLLSPKNVQFSPEVAEDILTLVDRKGAIHREYLLKWLMYDYPPDIIHSTLNHMGV